MLEVFTPVPWAEFCDDNVPRLTNEEMARGLVFRFRWVHRLLCVAAICTSQDAMPVAPDSEALDLRIAAYDELDLRRQIRAFAEAEVQRRHALHLRFERVIDERGRVHLARPFRSTAICRVRLIRWTDPTDQDLTCRVCIRKASSGVGVGDPAYAQIVLTRAERVRARLRLEPAPAFELIRQAMDERFGRPPYGQA
jgi:hypothetical protein